MSKPKRVIFYFRRIRVGVWGLNRSLAKGVLFSASWAGNKRTVEGIARRFARRYGHQHGVPVQFIRCNLNGRIGRGDRSEASYGCDSRAKG